MIVRVIFLAAAIFFALQFFNYLKQQPPAKRKTLLRKYLVYGLILAVVLLALTGRMHWIGGALAALFGLLRLAGPKLLPLLPWLSKMRGSSFGNPVITTRFLKVSFNVRQRQLSGEVIAGEHVGKTLAELGNNELQSLLQQYQQHDPESARLLSAYIYQFRRQQSDPNSSSSSSKQQQTYTPSGDMDRHEALQILGLDDDADEKAIVQAHRRLMQKMHPDRGGSDYLAAKINQAKDFLLKT